MPTTKECICCRHADFIYPNLEEHKCITQIDSYENLVLNPNVLVLAYIQMMMIKRQHGRVTDEFKGNYI
jgi:hypothetical protein